MKNLFGWQDAEYLDRYAGMSDAERFKRLTTKANVDMVLNHFGPFNKVKKQKHDTKTVISYSGTNIDKTVSPMVFNPGNSNKSQIIVNSGMMREHLDTLPEEERDNEFINYTKKTYVARAEQATAKQRFSGPAGGQMADTVHDSTITRDDKKAAKVGIEVGMQVSVAAQGVIQGVPMVGGTWSYDGPSEALEMADSLMTGAPSRTAWGKNMIEKLGKLNRSRSDFNNWIDNYKVKLDADYAAGHIVPEDESVLSDHIPLQRMFRAIEEPKDNEAGDACTVGHGLIEQDTRPSFVENKKTSDIEYSESNDTLEYDELSNSDKSNFFQDGKPGRTSSGDWDIRDRKMETLAEALYESLVGKIGKIKSMNPSKRLNTRALTSDFDERIYVYKSPLGGKHLSVNLILDTSGSMSGHYIQDSVDVINCVNKLALRGVITGNLMLSCSGASSMMKLPIEPKLLPKISAHNGGEGFRHTFAIRWKELKEADYNVALTDGHLTDGHIDKTEMHKEGIYVTGLYSMPHLGKNKAKAASYTNRLSAWFTKSAVRSSSEELIYYMIDQAILSYDMNPRSAA